MTSILVDWGDDCFRGMALSWPAIPKLELALKAFIKDPKITLGGELWPFVDGCHSLLSLSLTFSASPYPDDIRSQITKKAGTLKVSSSRTSICILLVQLRAPEEP